MATQKIDLTDIPDVDLSDIPNTKPYEVPPALKGGLLDTNIPLSERLKTVLFGRDTTPSGNKITGDELQRVPGVESLGEKIKNLGINTGNWYAGVAGSILGDLVGGASTATDPRTVFPKTGAAESAIQDLIPKTPQRLALPPAEVRTAPPIIDLPPDKYFVGGPSGGSGQVVERATAEANPTAFYKVIGSGNTPGPGSAVNLGEVSEQNRLANLAYGPESQYPGSRLTVPDKPFELPPEAGDTTGGFAPKTSGEMQYPYNVVPEQLRPRAAQTEVLGSTGIKGMDLSDIPEGPKYNFYDSPATKAIEGSKPEYYTGTGKPAELLHQNRLESQSEIIDQLGKEAETAKPDEIPPSLTDNLNNHKPPEMDAIPPPGSARPIENDIRGFQGAVRSTDQLLASRKLTRPIVEAVREGGWDKYTQAVGTWIRQLGDITNGMNKEVRQAFGRAAEGIATTEDKQLLSSISDVDKRLTDYRGLMDNIFNEAKVARGDQLGYIKDYVTHVEKIPENFGDSLKAIFNYTQGKNALKALFEKGAPLTEEGTGEAAGMYGKGMGNITESPFAKTRVGSLDNLDYDVNKIGRMYVDSMAREAYLRPAIQKAEEMIKDLPESKIKTLAEQYVKNITRFDSAANLNDAYKKTTQFLIDTTGRSMMGLNPWLQYLHFLRLGPVWWNLGTRDFANGIAAIIRNPAAAYRETASLGMLPNELYPMKFQTWNERANSFSNFKSMVDFFDRSVAYNGYKAQFERQGMNATDAMRNAINETKRTTFTVDPSRANVAFTPEYSPGGSLARLITQYKQVPSKIVEEVFNTAKEAKANPAKAARMLGLLGVATVSSAMGGPDLFHMPTSLTNWSGASITEMARIWSKVYKGDPEGALTEIGLWLTPGGKSTQRLLEGK